MIDAHTHNLNAGCRAVINLTPQQAAQHPMKDGCSYSIGIHPWDTSDITEHDWATLERVAANEQVVAIGECGLDALSGAELDVQEQVFRRHVLLSEAVGKPLIVHSVKTLNRIIELRKELHPSQPWILHGFRGKPQQALQLLNAGIDISLGEKFNPLAAAVVPAERLYVETDDSSLPISEIAARVAKARDKSMEK